MTIVAAGYKNSIDVSAKTFPVDTFWMENAKGAKSGLVHMSIAPGRSSVLWKYDRNLDEDVNSIVADHKVDVVVSLLENFEYNIMGMQGYDEAFKHSGVQVIKFPILDVSIPKESEFEAFNSLINRLHKLVWSGKNILVHCRGGKGRSGMVAASLLIKAGVNGVDSIAFVRDIRAGAIETFSQEDYVFGYLLGDKDYAHRNDDSSLQHFVIEGF